MRRKSLIRSVKASESTNTRNVKHSYSTLGGIGKFLAAAYEDCILVPFTLVACIAKGAIRKVAAKIPLSINVNDCGEEPLCIHDLLPEI